MKKITSIVLCAITVACAASCQHRVSHRRHGHRQNIKVYHLPDGRYCYQGNDMLWYWLLFSNNAGSTSNYYTGSSYSTVGTRWSTVSTTPSSPKEKPTFVEPDPNVVQDFPQEMIVDEVIVVDDRGYPEVDADGNLVDPDALSPDGGYGPDESSSTDYGSDGGGYDGGSSDSGSSDSGGGGGDSGGD